MLPDFLLWVKHVPGRSWVTIGLTICLPGRRHGGLRYWPSSNEFVL